MGSRVAVVTEEPEVAVVTAEPEVADSLSVTARALVATASVAVEDCSRSQKEQLLLQAMQAEPVIVDFRLASATKAAEVVAQLGIE